MPRKHKSSGPAAPAPLAGPQRLNKLLAAAGLGSRREVEQYILDGRIEVDGQPVTDLATKVDPQSATITFDGSAIKIFRPVYFALNKPIGVLSTNRDPSGRMRAIDLVNVKERIFSAGRLDRSSEGLMLLTNDGELAQRLSHPRYGIQKLYLATVQGEVTQADLEKLIRGVRLAEGYAKVDAVKLRKQRSGAADLEIALSEGKNREIRRILARLGHKVVALKRLAIGPLRLGQLPTGGWRPLTKSEIQALYSAAISGRRKKRGTGKPLRGKPRPGGEDVDSGQPMSAGQFDRYSDDEFEDDYGPSLDEMSDDELGGDDDVILNDQSLRGSVIPYDDTDEQTDDNAPLDDAYESIFNSDDDDDFDESGFDDSESDGEPDGDERSLDAQSSRRRPPARDSRRPGSSTRSPHDLRNRKQAGGRYESRERSGDSRAPRSSSGERGARPASGTPRGPKKGARPGRPASSRPGSRSSSSGPRQSSYSRSNSSEGRGPARSSSSNAPRSGSGPRSSAPRSGNAPRSAGPGRSAPRTGGPNRSGGAGPGRSGPGAPGRSGPGRGPGNGGPGQGGPNRGGPNRSGPSRGGPSRGGSGGPGRSGPGRSGPGRGGPGKSGPRGGGPRGGRGGGKR